MSNKPAWASEYVTYEDIVRSWRYTVISFETFGSCQGDHLALVERPGEIGLTIFGYGSCSGCDVLHDITPWGDEDDDNWTPVIDLASTMRDAIHWEADRDALRAWIDEHPENHWWSYDDDIARWLNSHLNTSLKTEDY